MALTAVAEFALAPCVELEVTNDVAEPTISLSAMPLMVGHTGNGVTPL